MQGTQPLLCEIIAGKKGMVKTCLRLELTVDQQPHCLSLCEVVLFLFIYLFF